MNLISISVVWSVPKARMHRPAGGFPSHLRCCGLKMSCMAHEWQLFCATDYDTCDLSMISAGNLMNVPVFISAGMDEWCDRLAIIQDLRSPIVVGSVFRTWRMRSSNHRNSLWRRERRRLLRLVLWWTFVLTSTQRRDPCFIDNLRRTRSIRWLWQPLCGDRIHCFKYSFKQLRCLRGLPKKVRQTYIHDQWRSSVWRGRWCWRHWRQHHIQWPFLLVEELTMWQLAFTWWNVSSAGKSVILD